MTKRRLWLVFTTLFIFHIFVPAQTAEKILTNSDAELARAIRERVEVGKTNQSIIAAVIDVKGVHFISLGKLAPESTGKANENTVFEIGSVTKVFTGILLAVAVEKGEVAFGDPISKYLPPEVKTPTFKGREITLLDLATQTSGLPKMPADFTPPNPANPYAEYTVAQMYDFLKNYQLPQAPGEKYEYSNFGMGLLGHILSVRAKMSYEELVKTRILRPLGMHDTMITLAPALKARMAPGFDQNGEPASNWEMPALPGMGALRSTAKDLAKFIRANIGSDSTLSGAFAQSRLPRRPTGERMRIGLAWNVLSLDTGDIIWHDGATGGYSSFVAFSAAHQKGIVILSNTSILAVVDHATLTNAARWVGDIGFHFLDPINPLEKIKPVITVGKEVLDQYVGTYQFEPNSNLVVTRRGERLFAQQTGHSAFRVLAAAENEFFYQIADDAQLTFNRDAGGRTISVTLHHNGDHLARKIL